MRNYQVMSADGHCEAPIDWSKRAPAKYKDVAPKLIVKEDGSEWWRMEHGSDTWERENGGNLYCGLRYDEFDKKSARTYHLPDGSLRPGTGDAVQRLREQDLDGLDCEVIYQPGSGPALYRELLKKDKDAYLALIQMYNNFLGEEYCSVAPDRLIGNCAVPHTGVDDAIAEIERCKKMGLRSVQLSNWPNGSPIPAPEDDRFWAASLDIDMRISPHVTFGGGPETDPKGGGINSTAGIVSGIGFTGGKPSFTIGRLIANGVFDRFPKLKFYFAESQGGWLAPHLDWIDDFYQRWYTYHDLRLSKQPSQYIRDHCRFSFIHDRMAMKLRHNIGVELLMWGSDFPHSVGTFPDSRAILPELFEGVPEAEKRQVLVYNVCDFFGLDPEKELTPTP